MRRVFFQELNKLSNGWFLEESAIAQGDHLDRRGGDRVKFRGVFGDLRLGLVLLGFLKYFTQPVEGFAVNFEAVKDQGVY